MRVSNNVKAASGFKKSGFLRKNLVYRAEIDTVLNKNLYKVKINGKLLKAFTSFQLKKGDIVFVKVKSLSPIPKLEIVEGKTILSGKHLSAIKYLLSSTEKMEIKVGVKDTVLDSLFFRKMADEVAKKDFLPVSDNYATLKLVRDKLINDTQQNFLFFSFPYIEDNVLREGFCSYKKEEKQEREEYNLFVELSNLGKIILSRKQCNSVFYFDFYTDNKKSAALLKEKLNGLIEILKNKGINIAYANVFSLKLQADPIFFINFNDAGKLDITI